TSHVKPNRTNCGLACRMPCAASGCRPPTSRRLHDSANSAIRNARRSPRPLRSAFDRVGLSSAERAPATSLPGLGAAVYVALDQDGWLPGELWVLLAERASSVDREEDRS